MSGPGAAANVITPGCCDSSLLLQGVLSQTPICLICFDSLLDTNEKTLRSMEVVVWNKCGHLFHSDCLTSVYGPFPSEVVHGKRRKNPPQMTVDENENVDEHGNEDDDEDEGDDDDDLADFDISSHCPKCPKCKQLDDACAKAEWNSKEYCNPVRRVFFDTESAGQGKPFPLVLAIPGQMTQRLDLAVVAKKLGVRVRDLRERAELLPQFERDLPKPWVKMAASIDEVNKEIKNLAKDILGTKTTTLLEDAAKNLSEAVPLLADCIEARKDQAKRLYLLKAENADLNTTLEGGRAKEEELFQLKARVEAIGDFEGMEALLEQRAREIGSLQREIIDMRWKAAESERRRANAYKTELCALRRAWKELVESREQDCQPGSIVKALTEPLLRQHDMVNDIDLIAGWVGRQNPAVAAAKQEILKFLEHSTPRTGEPSQATSDDKISTTTQLEIQGDLIDLAAVDNSQQRPGNLRRKRNASPGAAAGPSKRSRIGHPETPDA